MVGGMGGKKCGLTGDGDFSCSPYGVDGLQRFVTWIVVPQEVRKRCDAPTV